MLLCIPLPPSLPPSPFPQVWLRYDVSMEMDGEISFNYSVHVSQGSEDRGFFFYIDEDLTDTVEVRH